MSDVPPVNVKVLFFGAAADTAGRRSIEMELTPGTKSGEAFCRVAQLFPSFSDQKLLFSVNEEYADGGEALMDGDELAVFTAVSGG